MTTTTVHVRITHTADDLDIDRPDLETIEVRICRDPDDDEFLTDLQLDLVDAVRDGLRNDPNFTNKVIEGQAELMVGATPW